MKNKWTHRGPDQVAAITAALDAGQKSRDVALEYGFANANALGSWLRYHGIRRGPNGQGGKRKGAGAPRKGEKERVSISCRVRPETLAALRAMGPRLGETLDRIAASL